MTATEMIDRWVASSSLSRLQDKAEELRKVQGYQSPRDKEHSARILEKVGIRINQLLREQETEERET